MCRIPVAGRNRIETENLIGLFLNTVVLRSRIESTTTFREALRQVRQNAIDAYAHQELPFDRLVEELHPVRDLSRTPVFQILFNMTSFGRAEYPGVAGSSKSNRPGAFSKPNRDRSSIWTLYVWEHEAGLQLATVYNAALFSRGRIEDMLQQYVQLLATLPDLDQPVAAASWSEGQVLSQEDLRQLAHWNATTRPYPLERSLHSLVEEQVDRSPNAIAVRYEEGQLTYAELDARANQLARILQESGVGPDTLVGVCLERSLEMVVALLATLKAGGAYVPMDPTYPAARLGFMIRDAKVPVLLIQEHLLDRLPKTACRVIVVDRERPQVASQQSERLPNTVKSGQLAYMIYTSGSTGQPKGALNTHRGIVNRLLWMQETFGLDPTDRVLQKTPFSFDVSVWEIFWPLLAGARLVMARPEGHKDPEYLLRTIRAEGITTLHFVPSMLAVFLVHPGVDRCPRSGE